MQSGFFDLEDCHVLLEQLGDPLPKHNRVVEWGTFWATLAKVYDKARKGKADRKPCDVALSSKYW